VRAARSTATACGGGSAERGAIGGAAGGAAAGGDAATEGEAESIGGADVTAADPAPGGAAGRSDAHQWKAQGRLPGLDVTTLFSETSPKTTQRLRHTFTLACVGGAVYAVYAESWM
jgi:hypothetical protein